MHQESITGMYPKRFPSTSKNMSMSPPAECFPIRSYDISRIRSGQTGFFTPSIIHILKWIKPQDSLKMHR